MPEDLSVSTTEKCQIVDNNRRTCAKTWTNTLRGFHRGIRIPRMDLFNMYEFPSGIRKEGFSIF